MLKSYLSTTRVGSFSLFTLQPLAGRGVRTDFQARKQQAAMLFFKVQSCTYAVGSFCLFLSYLQFAFYHSQLYR